MNLQEFYNKYNGRYLDYDKKFGFQCKDVFSAYNDWILGYPYIYGDAKNMFINGIRSGYYYKVDTPQRGDIVVWGQGMGVYGHIAIFEKGSASNFISFDQNYPSGSPCHFQGHSNKNVIGFMRPKKGNQMTPEQLQQIGDRFNSIDNSLKSVFQRLDKFEQNCGKRFDVLEKKECGTDTKTKNIVDSIVNFIKGL